MDASFKPYLIRAIYEWCADQGFSPYLAVAVDGSCKVPLAYVRNGQIVLDISMQATHQLELGNDAVSFQARFGGVAQQLFVPITRVMGVFPEHDQQLGAFFEVPSNTNADYGQAALPVDASDEVQKSAKQPRATVPVGKSRITRVK